ncbi:hypothetical protein BY996DRAFT_6409679 [Phakopsora pachyrhizi]|nr:hypothetical protein BY996DRAFT_6409679 [Phakopsora pachyrhizi]
MDFVTAGDLQSALKSQDEKVELICRQIDFQRKKIQAELDNLRKDMESRYEKIDNIYSTMSNLENLVENENNKNVLETSRQLVLQNQFEENQLNIWQWNEKVGKFTKEIDELKKLMVSDDIPGLTKLEIQMRELYQQMNSFNIIPEQIREIKNDVEKKWAVLNQFCSDQQNNNQIKLEAQSIEAVKKDIFELKNSAVFRDNLDLVRLEVQCNDFPKQLCSVSNQIKDIRADLSKKVFVQDDLWKKQLDINSKNIQGQGKIDLIQNDIKDLRNSVVFKDNHDLVRLRDENIVLKQRLDSVHNIPSKVEEIKADLSKNWVVVNQLLKDYPDFQGLHLKPGLNLLEVQIQEFSKRLNSDFNKLDKNICKIEGALMGCLDQETESTKVRGLEDFKQLFIEMKTSLKDKYLRVQNPQDLIQQQQKEIQELKTNVQHQEERLKKLESQTGSTQKSNFIQPETCYHSNLNVVSEPIHKSGELVLSSNIMQLENSHLEESTKDLILDKNEKQLLSVEKNKKQVIEILSDDSNSPQEISEPSLNLYHKGEVF